ncbi:MAG: hypothetical protein HY586_04410 [Candidatus Omnitrophica bacterium]|nr:hypothetical protein [Candidatus Omnitrophota bacterium]
MLGKLQPSIEKSAASSLGRRADQTPAGIALRMQQIIDAVAQGRFLPKRSGRVREDVIRELTQFKTQFQGMQVPRVDWVTPQNRAALFRLFLMAEEFRAFAARDAFIEINRQGKNRINAIGDAIEYLTIPEELGKWVSRGTVGRIGDGTQRRQELVQIVAGYADGLTWEEVLRQIASHGNDLNCYGGEKAERAMRAFVQKALWDMEQLETALLQKLKVQNGRPVLSTPLNGVGDYHWAVLLHHYAMLAAIEKENIELEDMPVPGTDGASLGKFYGNSVEAILWSQEAAAGIWGDDVKQFPGLLKRLKLISASKISTLAKKQLEISSINSILERNRTLAYLASKA